MVALIFPQRIHRDIMIFSLPESVSYIIFNLPQSVMQTRHELERHLSKNNYLLLTINVTNKRQHHAFFQRFLCHKCSQQCQHWKFMKLFVVYKMILFSICLWYKLSLYKLLSLVKLPLLVQLKVYIISYSLNRFSEIESLFL